VEVDVDVDVYFVALFDRQVWVCLTEVESEYRHRER